jgi:hypothetical protein
MKILVYVCMKNNNDIWSRITPLTATPATSPTDSTLPTASVHGMSGYKWWIVGGQRSADESMSA